MLTNNQMQLHVRSPPQYLSYTGVSTYYECDDCYLFGHLPLLDLSPATVTRNGNSIKCLFIRTVCFGAIVDFLGLIISCGSC